MLKYQATLLIELQVEWCIISLDTFYYRLGFWIVISFNQRLCKTARSRWYIIASRCLDAATYFHFQLLDHRSSLGLLLTFLASPSSSHCRAGRGCNLLGMELCVSWTYKWIAVTYMQVTTLMMKKGGKIKTRVAEVNLIFTNYTKCKPRWWYWR